MRSKKRFVAYIAIILMASAALAPIAAQGRLPAYKGIFAGDALLDTEYLISLDAERYGELRNEVYASYGRAFVTQKYRDYFSQKPWYKAVTNYSDSWLTPNDRANIALIQSFENPSDGTASRNALAIEGEFSLEDFLWADGIGVVVFTDTGALVPASWGGDSSYYQWDETNFYEMKGSWALVSLGDYRFLAIRFDFTGKRPVVSDAFLTTSYK